VVDSVLDFNTINGTGPNVTEVKETLVTAIRNANFSFNINNATINATEIPEANGQCIYNLIVFSCYSRSLLHCEPFANEGHSHNHSCLLIITQTHTHTILKEMLSLWLRLIVSW